jgi:hypothetical protein
MARYWLLTSIALAMLTACNQVQTTPETPPSTTIDSFGANPNPSPLNVGVQFSWTVVGQGLACKVDVEGDGITDYTVEGCTSQSRVVHNYGVQGTYTARLTVSGADGKTVQQTTPVAVAAPNNAPNILSLIPTTPGDAEDPLEVQFSWMVTDPDADITHCRFDAESDGVWEYDGLCSGLQATTGVNPASTVNFFQRHKYKKPGRYEATLEAADPHVSTRARVQVRVPYNRLPRINQLSAVSTGSQSGQVKFRVSDEDGDTLTCTLRVETLGLFRYSNCNDLTRNFTFAAPGSYRVTLTVSDGLATIEKAIELALVKPPQPVEVKSVALGWRHTCALLSNGDVYCWGDNDYGQVGNDPSNLSIDVPTPTRVVQGERPDGVYFTALSAGDEFTCGTASDGEAYCWGLNDDGNLGNGDKINKGYPVRVARGEIPAGVKIEQISLAMNHTCALAANGEVYCWGFNQYWMLGTGGTTSSNTPKLVAQGERPNGVKYTQLTVETEVNCGLGDDDEAYCWGRGSGENTKGGNGNGSANGSPTPVKVLQGARPAGVKFSQVETSFGPVGCGLGTDSKAYCWGLGGQTNLDSNVTSLLGNGINAANCGSITPSSDFFCGIFSSRQFYYSTVPVAVQMPAGGVTFTSLAATFGYHNCAVGSDGKSYCWGSNRKGQLGDGTTNFTTTPVLTLPGEQPAGTTFKAVAGGGFHSCGVLNTGQLLCWGLNEEGQLGNGVLSPSGSTTPTPILVSLPTP